VNRTLDSGQGRLLPNVKWPKITHIQDRERGAYDAELEPGMTICIENYMGEEGGREGVKLE